MPLLVLLLTTAHQPHFPVHNFPYGSQARALQAEPSVAYYDVGTHTYEIAYEEGDFMYIAVLAPSTRGFYSDVPKTVRYDIALNNCTLGPAATNSHATHKEPGALSYEPFGESEFATLLTVVHGHTSNVSQTCVLTIDPEAVSAPYVVVAGTKEEVIEAMVAGLPIWVAFVSAWNSNHVYIYALGILLLFGAAASAKWTALAAVICASAVLLATSISRVFQIYWADVGAGQIFAAVPVITAIALVAGRRRRGVVVALLFVTLLSPTHSWLDVAAIAFVVYSLHLDHTRAWTTGVPSTTNPPPSFTVRY